MSHSEIITKRKQELPTRIKNIPEPSEHLERRYTLVNAAIAEGSKRLLKAQLETGHHVLTPESFIGIARKYGWQYKLLQHSWL